jgi:hypothetical protein
MYFIKRTVLRLFKPEIDINLKEVKMLTIIWIQTASFLVLSYLYR